VTVRKTALGSSPGFRHWASGPNAGELPHPENPPQGLLPGGSEKQFVSAIAKESMLCRRAWSGERVCPWYQGDGLS